MTAPALIVLALLQAGPTPLTLAGQTVTTEGDQVVFDAQQQRVVLAGNAVLRLSDIILAADRIEVTFSDPDRPVAVASGSVVFDDPVRGRLTGQNLRYELGAGRGRIDNVDLTIPLHYKPLLSDLMRPEEEPRYLYATAAEATQSGDVYQLRRATATTSTSRPPQFMLRVDRLAVTTAEDGLIGNVAQVEGEGVKLQLYGRTVLGLPHLNVGEGGLLLPRFGVNSTDGVYLEHQFSPFAIKPARFTLVPRIGTDSQLTGRARFAIGSPVGVFELLGSQKERRVLLLPPDAVQFSRIPEVAWKYPDYQVPGIGGTLFARFSYGQYDEEGATTTWRSAFHSTYIRSIYQGRSSALSVDFGGAWAHYASGTEYRWLRGGLDFRKRFGYRFYTGVNLSSHLVGGATPFRWDSVDVATLLNLETRVRLTPHWLVGAGWLTDLNRGVLRGERYSLAFRDRMVEYGVTVSNRPVREAQLDLRVLGF